MVPRVDTREPKLHGPRRVQNDLGTKALSVALFVIGLLLLAAIAAPPARANLAGPTGGSINQVDEVVEATTATTINEAAPVTEDASSSEGGASPDDSGAIDGEESKPAPAVPVLADLIPPVAHKAAGVAAKLPPASAEATDVTIEPLQVVEEALEAPLPELPAAGISPVTEVVEDIQPSLATLNENHPVAADVVVMAPTEAVDVVGVLPLFEPPAVGPGSIEASTAPAMSTISLPEPVIASQPMGGRSQQVTGLFSKELVAEMTLFHSTDTADDSVAGGPAAAAPERETAALAAYVPIAGAVPVVGGVGGSAFAGSSQSGSGSFAAAFDFFAAMAALLALCLLGLIRDRSRSGRSIFPSHGGRPG
jgi:hypothetical protein